MNAGGVAAVVDYVSDTKGNLRLPGIMMLGYIGAQSENLAMAVIVSKVSNLLSLVDTLACERGGGAKASLILPIIATCEPLF